MTIERSHGKARPTLPRSSDLAEVAADGDRPVNRDGAGRFAPGNVVGRGKGWKRACAKMLGRHDTDPVAQAVSDDAWKLFSAAIREMPSDGATVRSLVAIKARHEALMAFWCTEAARVGLATPEGIAAQDQATKHGMRAERLAVSAIDIATRLARSKAKGGDASSIWMVEDNDEENT